MSGVEIRRMRSDQDAEAVRMLAWEFIAWLRDRYPERVGEIDAYMASQKFEQQIARPLIHFTPPDAECLLALLDGTPVGILMLKRKDLDTCEMNRMYVAPDGRRRGIGRALCDALIGRARELGYRRMFLSALDRHHEALSLYRSIGFTEAKDPSPGADERDYVVPMRLELG